MTMTERQAAVNANKIYAMWAALDYEARVANVRNILTALDHLGTFMSATQLAKLSDFEYSARNNYLPFAKRVDIFSI